MKKPLCLLLCAFCSATAFSQSNTFPSSGNVGVGTTSPTHPLHIKTNWGVMSLDTNALNQDSGFRLQENGLTRWHIYNDAGSGDVLRITRDAGNVSGGVYFSTKVDVDGTVSIVDGGKLAGTPLLRIGDDTYFTDLDIANTLGLYGAFDASKASLKLGSSGPIVSGSGGNLGIGTSAPSYKLDVNGTIRAKEVIVETSGADFVFESDYRLRSLREVEEHIAEFGHLPDVPSAATMQVEGMSVAKSQTILLLKVEELTLYAIEKDKQVAELNDRLMRLEALLTAPSSE